MRFFSRTPVRTFFIYPIAVIAFEWIVSHGEMNFDLRFTPLMLWGFLQYYLCGRYRLKRGGGGPGIETPPDRLVDSGPYALTRNPMYLGHIIFLTGLTLAFKSWLAALITMVTAIWFHRRVLNDERKLPAQLGPAYVEYRRRVKRWIPGLF
jgi:protein-S-isoprenylcysteine O-methyltransferase Ste14